MTSQRLCTNCKFIGEEYWSAEDDWNGESGHACIWPGRELPASLRWANRERISVKPSDASDCSWFVDRNEPPNAVEAALEDLVMAIELPGDHCELGPALERARAILERGKT
jgi:hypothetical protein